MLYRQMDEQTPDVGYEQIVAHVQINHQNLKSCILMEVDISSNVTKLDALFDEQILLNQQK